MSDLYKRSAYPGRWNWRSETSRGMRLAHRKRARARLKQMLIKLGVV